MSKNIYSKLELDNSYKLIQLTPDLLEILKGEDKATTGKPKNNLHFKSLDTLKSNVVLCSNDKTWLLKQKDHSNTVLLLQDFIPDNDYSFLDEKSLYGHPNPTSDFLRFSGMSFEFEPRSIKGQLNLDLISFYLGEQTFPENPNSFTIKTF